MSYDLAVIGSGPGGYVCAIRAAQLGLKVALVEKNPTFGGTCINIGCIPSKALLHTSHLFEEAGHDFPTFGIKVGKPELDLAAMMAHKAAVVEANTTGLAFLIKKNKIDAFQGTGRIAAPGKVAVAKADGSSETIEAKAIVIATGSEVQLALAARAELQAGGVAARVVSMPCREWFDEQDDAYRESVLPASVRARVSVEAGVAQGWRDVVGDAGRCVSVEQFGASADYQTLFRELGVTAEAVVAAARESLEAARGTAAPGGTTSAPPHGGTADR